jgi:hypothetical protein
MGPLFFFCLSSGRGARPAFRNFSFCVLLCTGILLAGASSAAAQNLTTFPATAVGTTTPTTQTVTVQVSGTVSSVEVLTMGAPHLDFTETADNCVGVSSGSCQVTVAFAPKYPGARNGAVVLLDASQNTVGTEWLTGIGQGSLAVLEPGAISIAAGQVTQWTQLGDGGAATEANLYLPSGVAVDGQGDIFIADSHHSRVREVYGAGSNAGTITTIAGNGNAGYESGNLVANDTPLSLPGGVAVDGAGNVYVADTNNNAIRKINLATNTMTVVAGEAPTPGPVTSNVPATSATLNSPEGIAVDAAGNLYIADSGNNTVREVSVATGNITTIAGTGAEGFSGDGGLATAAMLNEPYSIALDAAGNLYIADSGNNRVREVFVSGPNAGKIQTIAGSANSGYLGDGGAATSAELYSPLGVACDPAGNVYIADARNYVIRKVSAATGVITTVAGDNSISVYGDGKANFSYGNGQNGDNFSGGGIATGAGIYAPYAVAVDQAGNLLIAEYFDHIIRKVTANAATLFFSPELWVNQVSSPEKQIVENDGNQPLSFSAVASDANAATDASSTSCNTTASLAVGAQCTVGAEFAPTSTANPLPNPLAGNVQLTGNPADSPLNISVVGQALGQNGAQVTLSSSQNPASYGQTVSLKVTVQQAPNSTQGTPTGTITYTDLFQGATTTLGTATLNRQGSASLPINALAVGTHWITASYSGDTYYSAASSNSLAQQIQEQVTVGLASSSPNDTSTLGTSVTFTATVAVSGGVAVSGSVSFYSGGTYLGLATVNGSGVATYTTATLPAGSNPITAGYTDSNNVSGTSAVLNQIVEQQTTTTLTSSLNPATYGTPVSFTAVVVATGSLTPTGTVTFYDNSAQIGTGGLTAAGAATASASFQSSSLAAGTHSITATYGGNAENFTSTSAPLTETVNVASTSTTLTASVNPGIAGKAVTFTATVTPSAGKAAGTVNFYNGTTLLGTGTLSGDLATWSSATLPVGSYSVTAIYAGNANDTGSTSAALPFTVEQATTSVQLVSSSPTVQVTNAVTFTATVSGSGGMPTGNVTFMDGANTLGSMPLNSGVASFSTSSLAVGTHSITAIYAGDANDAGSTSGTVTEAVTAYATTTQLAASATKLTTDQSLTLLTTTTSSDGGAVTGTITYMNGTTTLGSATVGTNGTATLTINPPNGTLNVTAHYSGDALNAPSVSNAVTVTVAQATEFTLLLNPTSLKVPTSQSATVSIQLSSQNSFSDKMALGCDSLPYSVTCNFASNDVTLNANGTQTVQLTVDTNSPLAGGAQAKNEMPLGGNGLLAACVFPGAGLFGFAFWRFRRNAGLFRALVVIAMLAGTTFLMTGCGGFSLNSAKPGSYVIQVTATGTQTGVTHVANLTVQVTQ